MILLYTSDQPLKTVKRHDQPHTMNMVFSEQQISSGLFQWQKPVYFQNQVDKTILTFAHWQIDRSDSTCDDFINECVQYNFTVLIEERVGRGVGVAVQVNDYIPAHKQEDVICDYFDFIELFLTTIYSNIHLVIYTIASLKVNKLYKSMF